MNRANENQHWISQVLLERFRIPGFPLECYQLETGEWISKSIGRACSSAGYNQLLISGRADNTIEAEFSKIETRLPKTLKALAAASKTETTELPNEILENICAYCACLKLLAPYSKPGAVVSFLAQINLELEEKKSDLLNTLNIPEEIIRIWQIQYSKGLRIIAESGNILQLMFRFQFGRCYKLDCILFQETDWTIASSPIELPISDVGLVPVHFFEDKSNQYILPLSPSLVLVGVFRFAKEERVTKRNIKGLTLSQTQAEVIFDTICASAVSEIICPRKIPNITDSFDRSKKRGIAFNKIPNQSSITGAGLIDATNDEIRFRSVSREDYIKYVHSHMKPTI